MRFSFYRFSSLNLLVFCMLILKAALLLAVFPWLLAKLEHNYQAAHFPDGYGLIAANWANGNGYRMFSDTGLTMLRSPGFIMILASIFWLFGKSLFAVQSLQLLMSYVTAAIIFYLAKRLFNSNLISLLASFIFLFHPAVLIAESRGGIESTLMLYFTACVAFSYRLMDNPKWQNFFYFGILFGWTVLVKSVVALYFPALTAVALMQRPKGLSISTLLLRFFVAGLISVLIQVPWIIRNYEISGEFVPTMSVSGLALFQGMYMVKNAESEKDSWLLLEEAKNEQFKLADNMKLRMHKNMFPQFDSPRDEINFYNQLKRLAMIEYMESPGLVWKAIKHNSWAFWFQGRTQKATMLNFIVVAPMLILMVWGAKLAITKTHDAWLLLIAIFAYIAPHLLILAMARYHIIIMPLISIFVAVSVAHIWGLLQKVQYYKKKHFFRNP
jgi:4-amino-4-deoxy-L-arabinose transferase-like glycosyltransferase